MSGKENRSTRLDGTRRSNGIVAAGITVFFVAHGLLGAAALLFGFFGAWAWLVWVGVAFVVVHVLLSVVTSYAQLTDAQRPPSPRKKRHLALKWATGLLLAACVVAHVVCKDAVGGRLAIVALVLALAVHLWTGSKSLLTDLGINKRFMMPFRVVVCVLAALFASAAAAGLFMR